MKLSKLFVLGAMGLVSLTASAAEFTLERTYPAPPGEFTATPVAFQADKHYVLYNTGAAQYFSQGGAWGTKASSCPEQEFANIMYFTKYLINGEWDGKTYIFKIYSTVRSTVYSWHECFFDSDVAMFVDRASQANLYWEVEEQGSNVYRLKIADVNPDRKSEGLYVGCPSGAVADDANVDANREYGTVVPISPKTSENIDWVFYSTDGWDNDVAIYEKSEDLKSLIGLAEEAGVDVSAAVSVYNAETSTLKDFTDAINALGEAMAAESGVEITGTAENPGDATEAITNPNFDDASYNGWLGTEPNMTGSGSHGPANVAEHYNHNFDTYQNLYGLPAGVYGLSAYTFYRGQWEDYVNGTSRNAFLYGASGDDTQKSAFANPWEAQNTTPMAGHTDFGTTAAEVSHLDEDTGVTYYIPNDPSAGRLYFEKGFYYNAVAFGVANGSARIGVIKETAVTNDWSVFDTFGLRYYGNEGAASYASWLGDNAKMLYATGAKASSEYVSPFLAAIDAQKANATDAASANAAFNALKESAELAALKENIALWGQWQAALNDAMKYTEGDYANLSAAMTLGDYISEADYMQNLSNDQIKAEIQNIAAMVEAVKQELNDNVTAGTDVTDIYIGDEDAKFTNGTAGWTLEGNCNAGAGCLEAYNQKFDLYKIVTGPQVGVYELELQGFFRLARDQGAFDMYNLGEQDKTRAWIYLNENKNYVQCVFDEPVPSGTFENGDPATNGEYWVESNTDNWYANTMTSANECFTHDMYKTKAYGLVANPGETLRLGVAGDMTGSNWMIWDNFKLIYKGFDADVIAPILEEAAQSIDLSQPMGKSVFAQANAAVNAASVAGDGTAMFNALKAIFAVRSEVESSVAVFAELTTYLEGMMSLFNNSENVDAVIEASEFVGKLQDELNDHKYEDSDVPALIVKIKEFRTKLRLPADYDQASDINPIEMFIIDTPSFDNGEGGNSVAGWEAVGYNFGNDETLKTALALEFYNKTFDLNQIIYAVPDGYYQVSAFAFERLNAEAETPAPAYLYAETGAGKFAKELQALDDTSINDMLASVAAFGEGRFANTINIKVSGGKLRLGIKKETNNDTDWVIMDDFTLTYFGTNSEMALDIASIPGDVNGDGTVDVADISAIISQMAGNATYAAADVNDDGTVDVADISAVITIMANSARKAGIVIGEE